MDKPPTKDYSTQIYLWKHTTVRATGLSKYLSNYGNGWEDGRRIDITSISLDGFEKWIQSSKRKTRPFAEYRLVEKLRESGMEVVTDSKEAQSVLEDENETNLTKGLRLAIEDKKWN